MYTLQFFFLLASACVYLNAEIINLRGLADPKSKTNKTKGPLDDVDNSLVRGCGQHKCFFRSKTLETRGYLLFRNHFEDGNDGSSNKKTSIEYFIKQYEFAKCLAQQYHIHTNVGYPNIENVKQDQLDTFFKHENSILRVKDNYFKEGELVVLPVKYDENAVFLICQDAFLPAVKEQMEKYIPLNPNYYNNFLDSVSKIKEVIGKKRCLIVDFQVFVNTEGIMYFFDLDFCAGEDSCTSTEERYLDRRSEEKRIEIMNTLATNYEVCTAILDNLLQTAFNIVQRHKLNQSKQV